MKNKIISAMLVGMSATMAVPVTAVMAAEGEPAATEATAAEAAVTEEAPAEETPVEETQAEEAAPENEAEEVQEEEAVPQVDENGEVTEAAKDAATPADFREKLSTGLFLVLRERILMILRISSSRPITGSSFWLRAFSTKSSPYLFKVS